MVEGAQGAGGGAFCPGRAGARTLSQGVRNESKLPRAGHTGGSDRMFGFFGGQPGPRTDARLCLLLLAMGMTPSQSSRPPRSPPGPRSSGPQQGAAAEALWLYLGPWAMSLSPSPQSQGQRRGPPPRWLWGPKKPTRPQTCREGLAGEARFPLLPQRRGCWAPGPSVEPRGLKCDPVPWSGGGDSTRCSPIPPLGSLPLALWLGGGHCGPQPLPWRGPSLGRGEEKHFHLLRLKVSSGSWGPGSRDLGPGTRERPLFSLYLSFLTGKRESEAFKPKMFEKKLDARTAPGVCITRMT